MKIISRFLICAIVALLMTSCGNPVKESKKAISNGDFVEAAKCITKLSVEEINEMEAAQQMEVLAICVSIGMSGDEEANAILNENLDVDKIEQKGLGLKDVFDLGSN